MENMRQLFNNLTLSEAEKRDITEYYEQYHSYGTNELPYSFFQLFAETGSRLEYENIYFSKRAGINSCLMMYKASGDKKFLLELEDMLWSVCCEFTWALPAHIDMSAISSAPVTIDLFAAETAAMLAEIKYILTTDISSILSERISTEIDRRIFTQFESHTQSWEFAANNWSAVCGGNIGMAYMYEAPERLNIKRFLDIMNTFLSGLGEDGSCTEGLEYWEYGFGYFMYFAVLLREHLNIDLISFSKVRNSALFRQNMFLFKNTVVSFSDSSRNGSINQGLAYLLQKEFPDIIIPAGAPILRHDSCHRFAGYIRSFLLKTELNTFSHSCSTVYYPDAQWYIKKTTSFAFAAKGGCNNESHNHNDVGTFIIANEYGQLIADFGSGEYTKDYFDENRRYSLLCCSSLGHSVPIIDGKGQSAGGRYRASNVFADDNGFCLNIESAYADIHLKKLVRSFKIKESSILLTDIVSCSAPVTERFISLYEPCIKSSSKLFIKNMVMECTQTPFVSSAFIKNHSGVEEKVWLIDYTFLNGRFDITFSFLPNNNVGYNN